MAEASTRKVDGGSLELVRGDITRLEVDAVVNAANSSLQLGGGVAGAIRRRGGPSIQEACDRIGHCPVGGAVVTGAGDLPARHVIHAVGPVWGSAPPEETDRQLASACREALARAGEAGCSSVALPALSSGIFGYPAERAARILVGEAIAHLRKGVEPRRVAFCLFGEEMFGTYLGILDELPPD